MFSHVHAEFIAVMSWATRAQKPHDFKQCQALHYLRIYTVYCIATGIAVDKTKLLNDGNLYRMLNYICVYVCMYVCMYMQEHVCNPGIYTYCSIYILMFCMYII